MANLFKVDLKNDKNISSLVDIIRGLAILLVIVVHVRNFIGQTGGLDFAYDNGYAGVIDFFVFGASGVALFFLISGFLMDYLYKDNMDVKKFALKRIARIFPAWALWHVVALIFATFAIVWTFDDGQNVMHNVYGGVEPLTSVNNVLMFLASLFFLGFLTMNVWNTYIPGGWSIQAEVTHYAVFPIINKTSTTYILILSLMLQAFGLITGATTNGFQIVASFITSPFWFFMGIILSRCIRNYKKGDIIIKPVDFGLLILNVMITFGLNGPFVAQSTSIITLILSILFAIIIFKNKFMSSVVKKVGKYSYGMYFNHFLVGVPLAFLASTAINDYGLESFAIPIILTTFILTTYISFVIGKILYEIYEKKFIYKANQIASTEK